MLNLTPQERKSLLFLLGASLIGVSISFAAKLSPCTGKTVKIDQRLFKADVNRCTYEKLIQIKGITPGLARSITEYRQNHGPFRSLEDLKEVKGIGNYRYEKLKDLLFID